MKRILLLAVLLLVVAPIAAMAGLDGNTDSFGVYFDTAGNTNGTTAPVFTPFPAYLLLMNPSAPTNGFECTVTPTGAPFFALATTLGGTGALDVDASANGFAVGAAANYPVVNGAVVLVSWTLMVQAATPLEFRITKASIPSMIGDMPVVTGDGVLRRCQVASCDVTLPVACVNGPTPPICPGISDPVPELTVSITAQSGTVVDSAIRAATRAAASDGQDLSIDVPKPSPPPAGYVHASFEHVGWSMGPRFADDVRGLFDPLAEYKVWGFMVETDRNGDVVLSFTPDFAPEEVTHLYLRDVQTGQYFNLRPALSYVFANNGLPNTYRFELICGAAPVPPALEPALRAIPAGWSMVGLPLAPNAGATVGSVLTDPAPGQAFAYDYVPGSAYRLLADTAPIGATTGYWLATGTPFNWSAPGERDLDGVTVPLSRGWNLVGYANWFAGPHEGVRVLHGGAEYTWEAAAQMQLVSASVQGYNPADGNYVEAIELQPWHAYWFNALETGVSLRFYWGHFLELPARLTAQKLRLVPDDDSWQSDLALVDATGERRTVTIGMGAGSTAGFDAMHDKALPPSSPAGGPRLLSSRPEWDLASGPAISRDIVALDDRTAEWRIVASSSNPGRAFLSWDPKDWPAGVDFQLYLPGENRVALMSMRATTSYPLQLGARAVEVVVRTPDMTSGVDAPAGGAYALSASPNPFNPATTITYELPQPGHAEVRVFSVRGELVAVLDGGQRTAGAHRQAWSGVDRQGRNVPSGTYFARLYLDGEARGTVSRMSLVR